jgi:hypothetical protein
MNQWTVPLEWNGNEILERQLLKVTLASSESIVLYYCCERNSGKTIAGTGNHNADTKMQRQSLSSLKANSEL